MVIVLKKMSKVYSDRAKKIVKFIFDKSKELLGVSLYVYQLYILLEFTEAFLQKSAKQKAIQLPRQSGKSESSAIWIVFFMVFGKAITGQELKVLFFAPTQKQASTIMRRIRAYIDPLLKKYKLKTRYNTATSLVLANGSSIDISHISEKANIESASGNFIIIDEAQAVDDEAVENKIIPMGTSFSAPIFYIGTAGTKICQFYKLVQAGNVLTFTASDVVNARRQAFQEDGITKHLLYEKALLENQKEMSKETFDRQYLNTWNFESSVFASQQVLQKAFFTQKIENRGFFSLDQSIKYDRSVLCEFAFCSNILVLLSVEYLPLNSKKDQIERLKEVFTKPPTGLVIDATAGQGTFVDWLEQEIPFLEPIRFVFTETSKSQAYLALYKAIREGSFQFLELTEDIITEFSNAQVSYSVSGVFKTFTPRRSGLHDDILSCCAMAFTSFSLTTNSNLTIQIV